MSERLLLASTDGAETEDVELELDRHRSLTLLAYTRRRRPPPPTTRRSRRWKGRRGSALFFWNVEPDGTRDQDTLHAGLPVTRGEKWLLSQWIGRPPDG
jgi:hypothetical protein